MRRPSISHESAFLAALKSINQNFEGNLIVDQLFDYKLKCERRELILNKISEEYLKEYLINKKKEGDFDF